MKAVKQQTSLWKHVRDIIILPLTVTVIIPFLVLKGEHTIIPNGSATLTIGIMCLVFGLGLFTYTVYLFMAHGRGTLAPWTPTQQLIVLGPYRYCRNPMITGVLFILIGESLLIGSVSQIIWTGSFFLINTLYFILKEEPDLLKRFGEDYKEYKKNVPRWIPRFKPYRGNLIDKNT